MFSTLAVALLKVGTFSKDDENVDDDVYDRFRPGTGPVAHRLRGSPGVDESSIAAAFCDREQGIS